MNNRTGRMRMIEAVTLGVVATGAVSIAIASIVSTVADAVEIFGSPVTVSLPVHGADMTTLQDAAGVDSAEYTEAAVSLATVDPGTRWLLLLETALPALATVIVCMALWWLGLSLIRQRTFRRSMPHIIGGAAIGLIVVGMIGPLLGGFARAQAVEQLTASGADTGEFWSFLFQVDLSPIGWGIALALVATAFEVGQRLQRETEGLI
ncbi:hypothetical protein HD600_000772 [Microbacterium ginsengiterrae]|uniref:DUF2975 family protein n=1 Tax=Microbacterium ginsengiterrae TaxID=546115 RepID=A0A7W9CAY4_9MICO|nr:hypothetical protein [Microbacterium ginsengiterrae]MBB5742275.1 hypothetical protein [Microbacterium ginsengiterrae]